MSLGGGGKQIRAAESGPDLTVKVNFMSEGESGRAASPHVRRSEATL